jgi:hypothetical protein
MVLDEKGALFIAVFFIAFGLGFGAAVGVGISWLAYRRRFTIALAMRAAGLGAGAMVLGILLSGWADARYPASWVRVAIARHGLVVSVALCCSAALLSGVRIRKQRPT